MRKLLFIFLIIGCKNANDNPAPEPKKALLEVEYKTFDTEFNYSLRLNNSSQVYIKHSDTSYFKIEQQSVGSIPFEVNFSTINGGYLSSVLVKFMGDTVKYQIGSTIFVTGTLPTIP